MGWSWVSLSTLPPHRSADPSLAPAAVLLQMKLPASLLGPYSHMPTASGWGWPPPSVPPPPPAPASPSALTPGGRRRRRHGRPRAPRHWQLDESAQQRGLHQRPQGPLYPPVVYREGKGDGTPPDGPRYQSEQSVQVLQADERQRRWEAFRWTSNYQIISKAYLKKHSTLPLCYSLSAADKKMVTSTMKKMAGPEARVETRVCAAALPPPLPTPPRARGAALTMV